MSESVGHHVEPRVQFLATSHPDVDARRTHPLVHAVEGESEHVLERLQSIPASREQGADRRVGQRGHLGLRGSTTGGEGALDLIERGRIGHAVESQSGDLVERRAVLGERGHTVGHAHHESGIASPAQASGFGCRGHQLGLGAFDAPRQGDFAEERSPIHVRPHNVPYPVSTLMPRG